jgi:outer membrane lipoprotein carrier protein
MRATFFLLMFGALATQAFSQNDTKAKTILDKVASTNNNYKTIKASFKFTTTTVPKSETQVESGTILMKGDKYHLTFSNTDIVFDGKSIYTYLKKPNEINITNPEPTKVDKGDFFFSNPRDIFKGYNKNFKSTFIKETTINKTVCFEIDLYPADLKTKYTRLKMHISKTAYQITDINMFLKDGTQYLLEFSNFLINNELSDNEFVFDTKKFPDAEVNDMRF